MRRARGLGYGIVVVTIVPATFVLTASCVSGEFTPEPGGQSGAGPIGQGGALVVAGTGSAGAPSVAGSNPVGSAGALTSGGSPTSSAGSGNASFGGATAGSPSSFAGSSSGGTGNNGSSGASGAAGNNTAGMGQAGSNNNNNAGRGGTAGRGAGGSMSNAGRAAGGMTASAGAPGMAGSSGTSLPPLQGGSNGYATRFWDCCKPHCGWPGNVPGGTNPMLSCNKDDGSLGGNHDASSACNGGNAHTCHNLAPWSVGSQLSYGYAATSNGDICGKCFQIQFTGNSHNAGNDPGSSALNGKQMIVQAINVGHDVAGGQFDLLVPGGGVGLFNACSSQWGVSNSELGEQYGGFLATCKRQGNNHDSWKSCVLNRCQSVFGQRGLTELEAGCRWFVEWFQVADNPNLRYREIACPQEITSKTGMRRP